MDSPIDWLKLQRETELPDQWETLSRREKQLYLLRFSSDPPLTTAQLAQAMGLQRATVTKVWGRVREKTGLATMEAPVRQARAIGSRRVTQGEFLERIERGARLALKQMPKLIPKGDLKSVSSTFRDLMMMRNLILGEPTVIHGSSDRRQVNEVVELLIREAKRRGIHIGTDSDTGNVVLQNVTHVIEAQARREP